MQQWGIAKNAASCMCVHKFTAAVVSVWLFRCLPLLFASSNEDMTPTKNEDTSCNCNIPLAFSCTQNSENKNYIKNLISIAEMRRNLIYMRKCVLKDAKLDKYEFILYNVLLKFLLQVENIVLIFIEYYYLIFNLNIKDSLYLVAVLRVVILLFP